MRSTLLFAPFFLLGPSLWGASPEAGNPLEARLRLLQQEAQSQAMLRSGTLDDSLTLMGERYALSSLSLAIHSDDAQQTVLALHQAGHEATLITPRYLTARVPHTYLPTLAALPGVKSVSLSRRFRPLLKEARRDARVDAVHKGSELETPFTGKGVVLGVIDQGFEFRHAAFMKPDGVTSRILAVWNRMAKTPPSKSVPLVGEKNGFHATHVTNIAAGSKVGNGWHGVAPEADIVVFPSKLDDTEVIENVKYLKDLAQTEGKPWVVNMSFGSQIGSHDGLTKSNQVLAQLTGRGALIAAAMGNDGENKLHASVTLRPGEAKFLLLDRAESDLPNGKQEVAVADIWGQSVKAGQRLKVTPFLYYKGKIELQAKEFWEKNLFQTLEVNADNGKSHALYYFLNPPGELQKLKKLSPETKVRSGLKIELASGGNTPELVHLWVPEGTFSPISIAGQTEHMLRADNRYQVAEGAAAIPTAIAVGSYNTATSVYSVVQKAYLRDSSIGAIGARSSFSNIGPFVNPDYPKPAVLAPGALIVSALNKHANHFTPNDKHIVAAYAPPSGQKFYYGTSLGTSMASPFVAGVLCLWLQANPQLDYQDVMHILKKTSRRGAQMGQEEWNEERGYGKIDAYAGLKEALALAKLNGIEHLPNSSQPVSIQKSSEHWRILLNNAERKLTVRLFDTAGQVLFTHHSEALQQGDELVVPFSRLAPGTYLMSFQTAGSHFTRKVLLR